MIGRTLSHYEILEQLGQGGMGVVYKARDSKLDRLVAIKVLPSDKTADPNRKQRFIREARAASALNHPNIVVIHEIAEDQGTDFIVMEFVSGKTLDHAIPRKGMRVGEALHYAAQIAAALAAAHEAGIIHRDIKPGNIMVSDKGVIKVLDFGLAKLSEPSAPTQQEATRTKLPDTEEGTIMGTVAYMSPEQAEAKPVDVRSDIFSFGAVFYEMLTGERAFHGETRLSTLAAILKQEPRPLRDLAGGLPGELERVVTRCLRKNPARRYQSTEDLHLAIEELRDESDSGKLGSSSTAAGAAAPPKNRWRLLAGVGAVAIAIVGAGWWQMSRGSGIAPAAGSDHSGPVLTQLTFDTGLTTEPAYWPSGNLIAYASDRATNGQNLDIWIQQLNGGEARRLTTHTADDREPSFSPDGSTIAFRSERDGGGIYLIPTIGGSERKLADGGHDPRFSPDGRWIAYWKGDAAPYDGFMSPTAGIGGLWVVAVSGGSPKPLLPSWNGSRPTWSPDSKLLLFAVNMRGSNSDWYTAGLEGGEPKKTGLLPALVQNGFLPRLTYFSWTPNGIVFTGQIGDSVNTWKIAMDPARLEVVGKPERITSGSGMESHPSLAATSLIYGSTDSNDDVWYLSMDHKTGRATGEPVRVTKTTASDISSSVSLDGSRIAYGSIKSGNITVFLRDLSSGTESRLVSLPATGVPGLHISPDGKRVGWVVVRPDKKAEIHVAAEDGTSTRLCEGCQLRSWGGEPSKMLFTRGESSYLLDPSTLVETKVMDRIGSGFHLSGDGKWANYYLLEPNNSRIYISPIREGQVATTKDQIPVTSGTSMDILPDLSPDNSILYFLSHRDGFQCLWAQRLTPGTMQPAGAPFLVQHFHSAKQSPSYVPGGRRRLQTARDKIVFTMAERAGNIWRATLPEAGSKPGR